MNQPWRVHSPKGSKMMIGGGAKADNYCSTGVRGSE